MQKVTKQITLLDAVMIFLGITGVLISGTLFLGVDLQVSLLMALFLAILYTLSKGFSMSEIITGMSKSIERAFEAMLIFILIGALIATFMSAGTIPSLIYYGLEVLNPTWFLPLGLLICSLTSVVTGTSWGTIGTVGVALLGIGESLGVPTAITAGMIVSGAFFGDKLSPMSDTTNLTAAATQTPLYAHIKGMLYTTVPSYVLALGLYALIGFNYQAMDVSHAQVDLIQTTLAQTFQLSLWTLLPMIVVLVLSVMRQPAIVSMGAGILVGVACSVVIQHEALAEVLNMMNRGYQRPTGIELVDTLICRGGIQSMMSTFSLAFIALSLGGILDQFGYLQLLVQSILKRVKKVGTLVLVTITTSIMSNAVMGEAYLSIILNASLYRDEYRKKGLSSQMLSRTLEEGATLTTGLIPWTTAGMFIYATLGVSGFVYAPFVFYNLLNIVVSIIFAYANLFVLRESDSQSEVLDVNTQG